MPVDVLDQLPSANVFDDEETLKLLQENHARGRSPGVLILTHAAEARGASTEWFGSYAAVSELENRKFLFFGHKGTESHVGARIIFDKFLTKSLLRQAGVPTPEGILVANAEEALRFRKKVGGPIVLKPRFGMRGRGVTVNLSGPKEVASAFKRASRFGEVLAETYIADAIDYRCLATEQTCVSVFRRLLPWVVGDGTSTIAELIEAKNADRQWNLSTVGTYIPVDLRTRRHLKRSELTLESVLPAEKAVVVRDVGGLSSGGDPYECSSDLPESVKATVTRAVAAIPGLSWAGCDVLIGPDGLAQVIEVNSDAGIGGARYPLFGVPQPIEKLMLDERLRADPRVFADSIDVLSPLETPVPLPSDTADDGHIRLPSLFQAELSAQGWHLEAFGKGTTRAVSPTGRVEWLRGCATTRDLDIVHRSVQRHAIVRGLLYSGGILRPRGRTVTTREQLRTFFDEGHGDVKMVRVRRPWESAGARVVRSHADIDTWPEQFRHRWMAQGVPDGARCWVIASAREPLAVLAGEEFSDALCRDASELAVEAIRAIPELRWGAVAIVFRPTFMGYRTPLVEGVSIDPLISTDYAVVAGSLQRVWDAVLNE